MDEEIYIFMEHRDGELHVEELTREQAKEIHGGVAYRDYRVGEYFTNKHGQIIVAGSLRNAIYLSLPNRRAAVEATVARRKQD